MATLLRTTSSIPSSHPGGQHDETRRAHRRGLPRIAPAGAEVTDGMLQNLDRDLTIAQLARRALMSSRTFARRFRADLGTTPAAWLNRQRILRAQQLLEQTDAGLEEVAQLAWFGTAAVMRHHFLKVLHTTPTSSSASRR